MAAEIMASDETQLDKTQQNEAEVNEAEDNQPPIYVARRLADAQRLEEVLTKAGVEYEVEPEEYSGGIIFRGPRVGAFFYVAPESRDRAVSVMQENGFKPGK